MSKHKLRDGEFTARQKEVLVEFREKRSKLMAMALEQKDISAITNIMGEVHGYAHAIHEVVKNPMDYLLFHEIKGSTPTSPCQHFDFPEPIMSVREFLYNQYDRYMPKEQPK